MSCVKLFLSLDSIQSSTSSLSASHSKLSNENEVIPARISNLSTFCYQETSRRCSLANDVEVSLATSINHSVPAVGRCVNVSSSIVKSTSKTAVTPRLQSLNHTPWQGSYYSSKIQGIGHTKTISMPQQKVHNIQSRLVNWPFPQC